MSLTRHPQVSSVDLKRASLLEIYVSPLTQFALALVSVRLLLLASSLPFIVPPPVSAQDVLTYHNSNARTGLNTKETILFTLRADGRVDAEPLYLSAVSVAGVTHNLLIVATEHGSVYGYDADSGTKIWQISTLKWGESPTIVVARRSRGKSASPPHQ